VDGPLQRFPQLPTAMLRIHRCPRHIAPSFSVVSEFPVAQPQGGRNRSLLFYRRFQDSNLWTRYSACDSLLNSSAAAGLQDFIITNSKKRDLKRNILIACVRMRVYIGTFKNNTVHGHYRILGNRTSHFTHVTVKIERSSRPFTQLSTKL
jgi:hypothetical protein